MRSMCFKKLWAGSKWSMTWLLSFKLKYFIIFSITVLIVGILLLRSLFNPFVPVVSYALDIVLATASIVSALGFFEFITREKEVKKMWQSVTLKIVLPLICLLVLVIALFLLSRDYDQNSIKNYREIAYGLNPFVQDSKQNEDSIRMANLVDACVIKWIDEGKELDYENLPADSDADGCFDDIEAQYASGLEFNHLPSFVRIDYVDSKTATIKGSELSNNKLLLTVSGSQLNTSYNFLEFIWDRFRFNNGKPVEGYDLVLTLIISDGKTKAFNIECDDEDRQRPDKKVSCSLDSLTTQAIASFIIENNVSIAHAKWNVTIGKEELFTNEAPNRNFEVIILKQ